MRIEVEISQIDRKHEVRRMKSAAREKQLLSSIVTSGIEEPLSGIKNSSGQVVLLDGFKRLRCAIKLQINTVPFISLGDDEATGILAMIRMSNAKMLSLLEQASFVEELKNVHGLSVAEIAGRLQRSKSWVVVRLQTLTQMSEATSGKILSGQFPLYSYLYTLHPYRRVAGGASKKEVDEFVDITAGKGLSTRDIELLSGAYFRGGHAVREQLQQGDLSWCLRELKEQNRVVEAGAADLSEVEKRCLRDLEILHGVMGRLTYKLDRPDIGKPAFFAQGGLMAEGILRRIENFLKVLRGFYDRTRQAQSGFPAP